MLPPGVVRVPAPPTLPSLPVSPKRPSSARIASRPAACHAASLIKAYDRRNPPLHRRKALPILSKSIAARKQAQEKKLRPSSLPSIPPPLRPYGISYFKQPPDSDGDFRPDLKKVFSGMGNDERGRGSFYKKRPFPSRHYISLPPGYCRGVLASTGAAMASPAGSSSGMWQCRRFSRASSSWGLV